MRFKNLNFSEIIKGKKVFRLRSLIIDLNIFLNQRCVIVLKNPRLRLRLLLNKKTRLRLRLRLHLIKILSDYDYVIDYVINAVIDYIIAAITHLCFKLIHLVWIIMTRILAKYPSFLIWSFINSLENLKRFLVKWNK